MQTFTELDVTMYYDPSDDELLIEFLSDLKNDFSYLDINFIGIDSEPEINKDGFIEHVYNYLFLKIKPKKEMDFSDIFHFGFFSYKYNFHLEKDDVSSIWKKQNFIEFKLIMDCNVALILMEEIFKQFFYKDHFLSPFTPISSYKIIENIPYRGIVVIKFETNREFEVADIFELGKMSAEAAARFSYF
jgi:hypothetical protein